MNRTSLAISIFLALNCLSAGAQQLPAENDASLKAALEFFEKSGGKDEFVSYVELFAPIIVDSLRSNNLNINEKCADEIKTVLRQFLLDHEDVFEKATARAFAERFTADELRALTTFFGSDLGAKFRTATSSAARNGSQHPDASKISEELRVLQQGNSTGTEIAEALLMSLSGYMSADELTLLRDFFGKGLGKKYAELNLQIVSEAGQASAAALSSASAEFGAKLTQSGVCP